MPFLSNPPKKLFNVNVVSNECSELCEAIPSLNWHNSTEGCPLPCCNAINNWLAILFTKCATNKSHVEAKLLNFYLQDQIYNVLFLFFHLVIRRGIEDDFVACERNRDFPLGLVYGDRYASHHVCSLDGGDQNPT